MSEFTERWSRLEPWLRANFVFPGSWNDQVAVHYDRELAKYDEADIAAVFRKLGDESHLLPTLARARKLLEQRRIDGHSEAKRVFQERWRACCRIYGPRMTEAFMDPFGQFVDWRPASAPARDVKTFSKAYDRLVELGALDGVGAGRA